MTTLLERKWDEYVRGHPHEIWDDGKTSMITADKLFAAGWEAHASLVVAVLGLEAQR